jgi:hypothetical protein
MAGFFAAPAGHIRRFREKGVVAMKKKVSRPHRLAGMLAVALTIQPPPAHAGMVSTEDIAAQRHADADRAKVRDFLERASVVEKMQAMGVDGVAAKDRVGALSQEEAHALAQRIDTLPAGGLFGISDLLIIILLVVLIVILI